jgi:hypothetical protein
MLAKYGYIELGERRGREKPWRLIRGPRDMRPSKDIPGSLGAVVELGTFAILREAERIRRFLSNSDREDPAWVESSTICLADFWVTREEMEELSRQLKALTVSFEDRNADPSLRPEGARRSRMLGVINPDPLQDRS